MLKSSIRAAVHAVAALSILTLSVAGCAGGSGSTPSVPNLPQVSNPANTGGGPPQATVSSSAVTDADRAAAANATSYKTHNYLIRSLLSTKANTKSLVYPADLTYQGGAVLPKVGLYNVYVDSNPSDFGNVSLFQNSLSLSNMVHITDQYVHASTNNRYPDKMNISLGYPAFTTLGTNDLLAILHHVAQAQGTGYGKMYNVFLPNGLDFCETGTTLCSASATSPNPAFCAFHGSVTFADIGHVLFSLEPFQDTNFCAINGQTQNDATYSTLSHETFETITDPDPASGWYDFNVGVNGEIGDLCAYLDQSVALNGHTYNIQREYSNNEHACSNSSS